MVVIKFVVKAGFVGARFESHLFCKDAVDVLRVKPGGTRMSLKGVLNGYYMVRGEGRSAETIFPPFAKLGIRSHVELETSCWSFSECITNIVFFANQSQCCGYCLRKSV